MDKVVRIKMKLKPIVTMLLVALSLISVAGITFTIFNFFNTDWLDSGDIIENILLTIFNSALLVEAVISLFSPYYKINHKKFDCKIGLINLFSVDSDKVTNLKFYKSGELVIFTNSEHFVLSISPKDYDKLKNAVKKFCKNTLLSVDEE